MAAFGQNFLTGAAAGFNAEDLMQQMQQKQLQNKRSQQLMQDEQKQRAARALLGQLIQGVAGGQGAPPIANGGQPNPGGSPPAAGAGAIPGAPPAPAPPGAQNAQPPGPPMGAQPGTAMGPTEGQFTWGSVLDGLRHLTGADPETVADAVMQLSPELDREATRKFQGEQAQLNRDQKNFQLLQTLEWRYQNSKDQTERAQIAADIKRITTEMTVTGREKVAGTNADARVQSAKIGADSRQGVADANAKSRENVANIQGKNRLDAIALQGKERALLETLRSVNANAARQVQDLQKQRAALDQQYKAMTVPPFGTPNNPQAAILQKAIDERTQKINDLLKVAPAKGTGGDGVPTTPQAGAKAIPLPAEVAKEPEGTVFEMDGKTYTKQGDKAVLRE